MPETYALTAETIAGLSCLMLAPPGAGPDSSLAVILHGLGRHKESTLPALYALARRGLRPLAFDVPLHGDRIGAETREQRLQTDYVLTMAEIVEGAVRDLSLLLDHLRPARAGVHGISLGGYVAYAALAREPRLTAAAVAMGSPDWVAPLRAAGLAPGHPLFDLIAARSPLEHAARTYPPRPLLIQHGDEDDVVPIAGDLALYERLRPAYQAFPERLELALYPGLGHAYTDEMMDHAAAWLARFLPAAR